MSFAGPPQSPTFDSPTTNGANNSISLTSNPNISLPALNAAHCTMKARRQRIPDRVFDFQTDDLYLALQYCQEDVLNAIDNTKVDHYLERMARRQLGEDFVGSSSSPAGYGGGLMYGGDHAEEMGASITGSRATASTAYPISGGNGGKGADFMANSVYLNNPNDGGEPPVNGDIAPYVRPAKRLNRFKGYGDVLLTFLPFGLFIPMVILCAILVGYMFAKVRLCGFDCACDASDIALITLTFGLIRDLPCSVVFACLTEACIEHQRSAAQTTRNRKTRADSAISLPPSRGGNNGNANTRSDGFQRMPGNINDSTRYLGTNGDGTMTNGTAHTYGPYILGDAHKYLLRKRVLALIFFGQCWVMLYRAFATPIGIPDAAVLPVFIPVKILPFLLYAFAKKKIAAVTSTCILIIMPIVIEIITEANGTNLGENRDLWTGFFPLLVCAADRFFLFCINMTSHPSRSAGALIAYCTMHAFFSQNLMLGVALTINTSDQVGLIVGYAISFAVLEIILNTVIIERVFSACWRGLKRSCNGSDVKKGLTDPIGKFSVPNIAAMVRLPSLIMSFIFMLPAMHFDYYPYKTRAIDCDGKTHYTTSWPTYGVLGGVIVVVAAISSAMRGAKGSSNVPLCVYGIGWSLLVSFYCLQVVPQSLSFLPLIGGNEPR